jgi:glycerol-3-phosphate dehydrogenase
VEAGASVDARVVVVGGGVVGAAVTYFLARHGVSTVLLEAQDELALGASGTNSGILHTGFDSPPGEFETELILRSAQLRVDLLPSLGVPVLDCGARVAPFGEAEARTVAALHSRARQYGVRTELRDDGSLEVPGEAATDPVAYTRALAAAAGGGGARVRTRARVEAIEREPDRLVVRLASGERAPGEVVVNCAGLHADEVARLAGDDTFEIHPRKGEFFVFDLPDGRPLERILLPVPTERTKGVLVFPSVDGRVIAGPTAHDQDDKFDWSVREEAWDEVVPKARRMWPPLESAAPVASYAGLRPAGRPANYLIGPSTLVPGLINVAAIRSTGLSASLGIGEHVVSLVAAQGVELGPQRPIPGPAPTADDTAEPWWRHAARYRERAA